jgi:YD repeat-containing protein
LNNVTTLAYFSTGLINYIQDAQGNRTTYAYDARGNRTSVTDARSKVTGFTYDVMNKADGNHLSGHDHGAVWL